MRVLDPYKLTYSQWIILHTLAATVSPVAVGAEPLFDYRGTSISVVIDGIERRNLIQRRRSRADRRMVKVRLTAEGRACLGKSMHR
jgi:DNA-binding MarR family transcriptional regulator